MMVNWSILTDFINQNNTAYLKKARGIPREDILAFEEKFNITFPQGYKDFLQIMGADKDFNAFGRSVYDFYFLTRNLPSKHYPANFFKIAHDADNNLDAPIDLFIDLTMGDGYDTPLMEYEAYNEFRPHDVRKLTVSLMEMLTRQLILKFVNLDNQIAIYNEKQLVVNALLELNLSPALPPQKGLEYLTNSHSKVLVELYEVDEWGSNILIYMGGDTENIKEKLKGLPTAFDDNTD